MREWSYIVVLQEEVGCFGSSSSQYICATVVYRGREKGKDNIKKMLGKFSKCLYVVDGIVNEIVLYSIFNLSSDKQDLDCNLYKLRTLKRLKS